MQKTHCDFCEEVIEHGGPNPEIKTPLSNGGKTVVASVAIGHLDSDDHTGYSFRKWDLCRECRSKVLTEIATLEAAEKVAPVVAWNRVKDTLKNLFDQPHGTSRIPEKFKATLDQVVDLSEVQFKAVMIGDEIRIALFHNGHSIISAPLANILPEPTSELEGWNRITVLGKSDADGYEPLLGDAHIEDSASTPTKTNILLALVHDLSRNAKSEADNG